MCKILQHSVLRYFFNQILTYNKGNLFQNTLDLFPWLQTSRPFTFRGTAYDSSIPVFVFRGIAMLSMILPPSPDLQTVPCPPRAACTNANVPLPYDADQSQQICFCFNFGDRETRTSKDDVPQPNRCMHRRIRCAHQPPPRMDIRRPCLAKNDWTSTKCGTVTALNRRLYFEVGYWSKTRRPRACVYTTQFSLLLCIGHGSIVLQCTRPDQIASVLSSEGSVQHEYISDGQGLNHNFWFGSTDASPCLISPQMTKKMTVWCVAKSVTTTHRPTRPNLCSSFYVLPNHRHLPSPDPMGLLPYLPN